MKLVLLLEDDQNRIDWFEKEFKKYDYIAHITEDVEEAKNWLRENKYELIFLDHDLGGKQMVSSDEPDTGFQVAKMIHETKNVDTRIIIHSWNPIGVSNMQNILFENKCPNVITAMFGTFKLGPTT